MLKSNKGYAVVANRSGSDSLRSFHEHNHIAAQSLQQTVDTAPLRVVPAEVSFASNGNVRIWCKREQNAKLAELDFVIECAAGDDQHFDAAVNTKEEYMKSQGLTREMIANEQSQPV
jgi:hypothetical protein